MNLNSRNARKLHRYRIGKGYPGLRAMMYKMMNQSYLDIRIYRGYRQLTRIVTRDTGTDHFTVENVGTFCMPDEQGMLRQYFDRHATYIHYHLTSSGPGYPVERVEPSDFEYPPLSPAEFQTLLEAQTVADLLSETERSSNWIWILLGVGVLLFVLLLVFQGGV